MQTTFDRNTHSTSLGRVSFTAYAGIAALNKPFDLRTLTRTITELAQRG